VLILTTFRPHIQSALLKQGKDKKKGTKQGKTGRPVKTGQFGYYGLEETVLMWLNENSKSEVISKVKMPCQNISKYSQLKISTLLL